jgi:hypothetical protein
MPGIGLGISPCLKRGKNHSPVVYGQVFADDFNSSNWTEEGTGATITYNANNIQYNRATGSFESLIRYNQWTFQTENFTIRAVVTVSVSANDVLFGIGVRGVSTFSSKPSFSCALWTSNDSYKGYHEIYCNDPSSGVPVADSGAGRLTLSNGDQVECLITFNEDTITFTTNNLTQGGTMTTTYTNSTGLVDPGAVGTIYPNVSQVCMWNYKGNYTLNSIKLTDNEYKYGWLTIFGDSKSEGYYVSTFANRFADQIASTRNKIVQVSSGSGNVTQDLLNALPETLAKRPENVIIFIGRNDLAYSVPSGTWQANYASIVSQLQGAGITVWHQLPVSETPINQSALSTWISSTYASRVIPEPSGWTIGTDCSADTIHFSVAGSNKIRDNILTYL